VCATYLIKISLATTLLRFETSRIWKVVLYVFMVITTIYFGGISIALLLRCIPFKAIWDPMIPGAHCWPPEKIKLFIIASAGKDSCAPATSWEWE
jgi:hypothetical protein